MYNPNNPSLKSWVESAQKGDFSLQNLPFGVFVINGEARVVSSIGEYVIDLYALSGIHTEGWKYDREVFKQDKLNDFIALGKDAWRATRVWLSQLLNADNGILRDDEAARAQVLIPAAGLEALLPVEIGDYTDFYSSIDHATNVGIMFRGKENALMPNWKWLPVGYHGRASSIVVSGTDLHRPKGQTRPNPEEPPVYGPCRLLDFELEMAFIVGKGNDLGDAISVDEAEDHIFGLTLFNDWSARDIQKWEYIPLGPFLGKNWGSSISPWIVTLDALEPFRKQGYEQDPQPLEYLQSNKPGGFDIQLEVFIEAEGQEAHKVCTSNFNYMYWTMAQQLAHHTVNGCNMRVGDMLASGTISGKDSSSYGSMLEISWAGSRSITLPDGSERKFIADHDSVIIQGHAEKDGVRVGFGEVRTKILPAK